MVSLHETTAPQARKSRVPSCGLLAAGFSGGGQSRGFWARSCGLACASGILGAGLSVASPRDQAVSGNTGRGGEETQNCPGLPQV